MHNIITQDNKVVYISLIGRIREHTDYALLNMSNINCTDISFDFKTAESIDAFFIEVLITLYLKDFRIRLLNVNELCNDRLKMSCINALSLEKIVIN